MPEPTDYAIFYRRTDGELGRCLARAVLIDETWHCGYGLDGWKAGLPETTWRKAADAIQCLHYLLDAKPNPVPMNKRLGLVIGERRETIDA